MVSVLLEAYVLGVSTPKVDDLVQSMGISGVSRRKVSRVCADLFEVVASVRNRPLEGAYPYRWLCGTEVGITKLAQGQSTRKPP